VVCGARSALPLAALEHGVPSVFVRGEDDAEGEHVQELVRAGCALRLPVERPASDALRAAVERTLADEALHAAARRVGAGFARLRGFGAAADAVEAVHAWSPAAAGARAEPAGV
jgi:UDP:flavonoid glycosyltransferase YjiC (YdhE family)